MSLINLIPFLTAVGIAVAAYFYTLRLGGEKEQKKNLENENKILKKQRDNDIPNFTDAQRLRREKGNNK